MNAVLGSYALSPGYHRVTFHWEFDQNGVIARGDGVARIAAPDSARLDLFVAGGFGGGSAALIGNQLRSAPGVDLSSVVPSPPLLWAAFGRLALPPTADTVIRVSGDTLRADVGRPRQWRVVAIASQLVAVDRVTDGKLAESVERGPGGSIQYHSTSAHTTLTLTILKDESVPAFDASIWTF